MRRNSVDGITSFNNKRAGFKFDTHHLRIIPVDKRAPLPPPKRYRQKIAEISQLENLVPDEEKPAVPVEKVASKPLPEKPILRTIDSHDQNQEINPKSNRFWQHKETQRKILLAMASLVFVCGMAVTGYGVYMNRKVAAINPPAQGEDTSKRTVVNSNEQPSEEPISDQAIWGYEALPDHPRLLMIPKLSLTARVVELGVDEFGNLQTPYSVWDTGWYRDSAKPGDKYGATLIDGHVSGMYGQGIFTHLDTLNKGDEIIVERGDRTQIKYKVVAKEIFKKDQVDMKKALKSANLTKHGLNLITCNGTYIPDEQTFSDRLLVQAVEID